MIEVGYSAPGSLNRHHLALSAL